ncbi:MAG: molybdopterin-binding protein, partial [Bacteroidota bacterium]
MTQIIKAELLTIGDEILYGQIVDTNSQWMSVELDKVGIKVIRKTTVGDQETEILTVFAEAEKRADIVLITGVLNFSFNFGITRSVIIFFISCGTPGIDIKTFPLFSNHIPGAV